MRSVAFALLLAAGFALAHGSAPQIGADPVPPTWSQRPGSSPTPNVHNPQPYDSPQDRMERQQRSEFNDKRQQQAIADATKLAQLSRELQDELTRANGATLPATSFKKADDIIKLAKSVKDKMHPL